MKNGFEKVGMSFTHGDISICKFCLILFALAICRVNNDTSGIILIQNVRAASLFLSITKCKKQGE